MNVESFVECLEAEFFTGVPDSQLKPLCDYLFDRYGISKRHLIAANEGNSTALAAGYHLATGKIPVVYLQNSGIGNIVNPAASLLNKEVYGIPCIFVVGWRGQPGSCDEPQHVYQGKITLQLLEDLGIDSYILTRETTEEMVREQMLSFRKTLRRGDSVAFVAEKGAFTYFKQVKYQNDFSLNREAVIERITAAAKNDLILSTTGKISRELYEIREKNGQEHCNDFLTVGSMGHCSSIALGAALYKPEKKIWCIDGDGAALMHMGAMALIGSSKPENFVHIVLNNSAHESVGGMPTAADSIDFKKIAEGCGYVYAESVCDLKQLEDVLRRLEDNKGPVFIEIQCKIGSRKDLGRPAAAPQEIKKKFMRA